MANSTVDKSSGKCESQDTTDVMLIHIIESVFFLNAVASLSVTSICFRRDEIKEAKKN